MLPEGAWCHAPFQALVHGLVPPLPAPSWGLMKGPPASPLPAPWVGLLSQGCRFFPGDLFGRSLAWGGESSVQKAPRLPQWFST